VRGDVEVTRHTVDEHLGRGRGRVRVSVRVRVRVRVRARVRVRVRVRVWVLLSYHAAHDAALVPYY